MNNASENVSFVDVQFGNRYNLCLGDYRTVLDNISDVDMFLCSPPYNIGSKSPARITNRRKGGFDAKSWGAIERYEDKKPEAIYRKEQTGFLRWAVSKLSKNGVIVYNHKNRYINKELITPFVWIGPLIARRKVVLEGVITLDYGSTCNHNQAHVYNHTENLFILRKPGSSIYFKNQEFYWKDTNKRKGVSDVWPVGRCNPHMKHKSNAAMPEKVARQSIRMWCPEGGLVCDPFMGSGTTAIAAYREGRSFIGSEIKREGKGFFESAVVRFKQAFLERGTDE